MPSLCPERCRQVPHPRSRTSSHLDRPRQGAGSCSHHHSYEPRLSRRPLATSCHRQLSEGSCWGTSCRLVTVATWPVHGHRGLGHHRSSRLPAGPSTRPSSTRPPREIRGLPKNNPSTTPCSSSSEGTGYTRCSNSPHPAPNTEERVPLRLALVLDRSGSMSGRATRRRDTLAYWLAVNPERVIACAVGPGRCARTRCAAASQPTQADHPPPRQTLRHPERSRRSVATRTSGSRVIATSPRRIVEPAGAKPRRSQKRGCSARSSGTGKSCGQYAIIGGCRPRCGDWGAG